MPVKYECTSLETTDGETWCAAPWLFCALLAVAVDVRAIIVYLRIMAHDRSGAKLHGKWWYPPGQFPISEFPKVENAATWQCS